VRYSEATLHYFRTAPAAGVLAGPGIGRGAAGARERGTWVQFDVRVEDGVIRDARFLAFGCPHTIAVSAWVVEQGVGHGVRPAPALPESVQALSERFAVPVEKRGRLLIVEDAWLEALKGAVGKNALWFRAPGA
jgi:NifU-like protein involved in Fe-S cluster formation